MLKQLREFDMLVRSIKHEPVFKENIAYKGSSVLTYKPVVRGFCGKIPMTGTTFQQKVKLFFQKIKKKIIEIQGKPFERKIGNATFIFYPKSPVTDNFVKEILEGIETLGLTGKRIIKRQQLKIAVGQKATDVFPDLKGVKPPGWSTGATIDHLPAFRTSDNLLGPDSNSIIGFFEKPMSIKSRARSNAVRHEIGHDADNLWSKIIGKKFSQTEGFVEALGKDIKRLPDSLKKYDKYGKFAPRLEKLLQGSTEDNLTKTGLSETFAEIFAKLNGGSQTEQYLKGFDKFIEKVLPETTAYIDKLLYLTGKR